MTLRSMMRHVMRDGKTHETITRERLQFTQMRKHESFSLSLDVAEMKSKRPRTSRRKNWNRWFLFEFYRCPCRRVQSLGKSARNTRDAFA